MGRPYRRRRGSGGGDGSTSPARICGAVFSLKPAYSSLIIDSFRDGLAAPPQRAPVIQRGLCLRLVSRHIVHRSVRRHLRRRLGATAAATAAAAAAAAKTGGGAARERQLESSAEELVPQHEVVAGLEHRALERALEERPRHARKVLLDGRVEADEHGEAGLRARAAAAGAPGLLPEGADRAGEAHVHLH